MGSGQRQAGLDSASLHLRAKWDRKRRLTEKDWQRIVPALPGKTGARARNGEAIRRFVEATLWVADTGAGWKCLPREYGSWRGQYMRFVRWAQAGLWSGVISVLTSFELRVALSILVDNYLGERKVRTIIAQMDDIG